MAQATNGELSQEIYDQFVKEGKINPKDFVPDPTEPIFHRMPGNQNLVWDAHTDQFFKTYYSPTSIDDLTTEADYQARQKEYQNVENPEIIIHEAFAPPKAAASLTEMNRIQSAYPQKIFIVAGGNTDSDIEAAIAHMSGQMQENGLIIGPFLSNFTPGPGARAHLDIKKMHSSSQAVGYTSGIMAWLLSAGASQHEALTAFQTSLTDKWVDAREGPREIHVFDQSSLRSLKQNFR
jgi:hypothetical protein